MPAKKRIGDWIAVLEAGYSLDGDDSAWLGGLLDCIAREHWQERISAAFTFDQSAAGVAVRDVHVHLRPSSCPYTSRRIIFGAPQNLNPGPTGVGVGFTPAIGLKRISHAAGVRSERTYPAIQKPTPKLFVPQTNFLSSSSVRSSGSGGFAAGS
jgi:hypothetical protein